MTALTRIKHFLNYFLIALFFILIALFYTQPVHAQAPSSSPSATIPYTLTPIPSSVSPTSPLYTDLLVNNLFHSFSCLAVGQSLIGQPCLTYQITKDAQGVIQSVPVLSQANLSGGALGATTSLIGMLYLNPPVRTVDYLASVGEGLGIVKEAKAQVVGSGAQVLNPILKLWQVSRNISYLIMIIIFVIIGLMVMFRQRINPQTVITAQAALPGLVIGLILITFSYFLAGLISDTAFIGTNLVGYYFAAAQGKTDDPERLNLVQKISPENVLSIFGRFTGIVSQADATNALDAIWDNLGAGTQNLLRVVAGAILFQYTFQGASPFLAIPAVGQGIQAGLATIAGLAGAAAPTAIVGLVLSLIAMVILLYSMLRLLLRLINVFLTIIFLTITAPFQFLAAALPGRQGIATNWILNMIANILAFPAVLAVFYFVAFILGRDFGPLKVTAINQVDQTFIPAVYAQEKISIVGNTTFPLFGRMDLEFIKILVAFGALVALPTIPDIIVRTIGRATQAGQLLGQEIGSGIGAGQRYAGQAQQGMGAVGERAGGLYAKTGFQYYYHPGEGLMLDETRTPGQLAIIGKRLGGWIGGKKAVSEK